MDIQTGKAVITKVIKIREKKTDSRKTIQNLVVKKYIKKEH